MHRIAHYALLIAAYVGVPGAAAFGCSSSGQGSTTSGPAHGGAGGNGNAGGAGTTGTGGAGMTGTGGAAVTSSGTGSTTSASSSGSGGGACVVTTCQGHVYQCGDCIDNDGDGLVDADDPDCLGPCDNTEDGYFGGIPGQAGPSCTVDCYFDQDSGSGNDDCHWNHKCDPHEVAPGYYPESSNGAACGYDPNANTPGTSASCDGMYNAQSAACTSFCGPLTPNGCDCFGCCELPAGTGKYVWLGSADSQGNGTCDLAHVSDPTKCQPCLPVKACLNDCKTCELCIGKTTLPPECYPDGGSTSSSSSSSGSTTSSSSGSSSSSSSSSSGGPTDQCPAGVQPCGLPGESPCPAGYYCITGCCQKLPT